MSYVNDVIFQEKLIAESIVSPQRHPFGNRDIGHSLIRALDSAELSLSKVIGDMGSDYNLSHYQRLIDDDLWKTY